MRLFKRALVITGSASSWLALVVLRESSERNDVPPHCLRGSLAALNDHRFPSTKLEALRCSPNRIWIMASKPHPPLMKKHSQTDLISRLKSRKILGVGGEDDDGEVHRSKISQMLGNEMKFAVREPIGLRMWLLTSAVGFTAIALMALVFPNHLYEVVFEEELSTTSLSVRLYGGALLSLALIMWNGLYTAEKSVIQWTLLSEACYFAVQFLVTSITFIEIGMLPNAAVLLLLSRVLFLVVTMAYYYHLGRKPKKV
ncbi:tumor protein p53-inducible protein 11-like isoform X1 [Phycodurus eques]|uniref:tumor protein p53-inducible protein 11-like isoform X1 n=2 Tax=Phycodurus eques TaxID=693459 RepID=UPI002ACEB803|nr:tumor protein p53-inducible protein 11-like isoform X1 [Phycodurus eques]